MTTNDEQQPPSNLEQSAETHRAIETERDAARIAAEHADQRNAQTIVERIVATSGIKILGWPYIRENTSGKAIEQPVLYEGSLDGNFAQHFSPALNGAMKFSAPADIAAIFDGSGKLVVSFERPDADQRSGDETLINDILSTLYERAKIAADHQKAASIRTGLMQAEAAESKLDAVAAYHEFEKTLYETMPKLLTRFPEWQDKDREKPGHSQLTLEASFWQLSAQAEKMERDLLAGDAVAGRIFQSGRSPYVLVVPDATAQAHEKIDPQMMEGFLQDSFADASSHRVLNVRNKTLGWIESRMDHRDANGRSYKPGLERWWHNPVMSVVRDFTINAFRAPRFFAERTQIDQRADGMKKLQEQLSMYGYRAIDLTDDNSFRYGEDSERLWGQRIHEGLQSKITTLLTHDFLPRLRETGAINLPNNQFDYVRGDRDSEHNFVKMCTSCATGFTSAKQSRNETHGQDSAWERIRKAYADAGALEDDGTPFRWQSKTQRVTALPENDVPQYDLPH